MKRGIVFLLFAFILIIPLALSYEERLVIHFHSITGSETTTINLWDFFQPGTIPVISETENVKVEIDSKTGVATITALDPDFKGIEEIIFAISQEHLEAEMPEPKYIIPGTKKNITDVKGEDIAEYTEAFTIQQFNTVVGNLQSEGLDIDAVKRRNTIGVFMGKQLFMNISYNITAGYIPPSLDLRFRLDDNNRSIAEMYTEPSEIMFFTLSLVILGSLVVLVLYIYYAYVEDMNLSYSRLLFTKKRVLVDVSTHKKAALAELGSIRGRIGKEKPSRLYKQSISVMNQFFAKALKIRGNDWVKIREKLEKKGATPAQISKIKLYFMSYKDKPYSSKDLRNEDVSSLISSLTNIIRNV